MLKAIGTLRLSRPLVANLIAKPTLIQNKTILNKNEFHTTAKKLGGGDQEFLVKFIRRIN